VDRLSLDIFAQKIFAPVFHSKIPGNLRRSSRMTGEIPPVMPPVVPILWRKRPKKIEPAAPKFGA
jgi:hypothetical protein